MTRMLRILTRVMASLFALATVLIALGVWSLSTAQMNSNAWTPYIVSYFERLVPDSHAAIGKTTVAWDNTKFTLALECENVVISDVQSHAIINFPRARVQVSVWSILRGRVLPRAFEADEALFRLFRTKDGQVLLGVGAPSMLQKVAPLPRVASKTNWISIFDVLQTIADEIASPFTKHDIAIKNLKLAISDMDKPDQIWDLNVREFSLTHNKLQAIGHAVVDLQEGERKSALQLTYKHESGTALHNVSVSFQDIRLATFQPFAPEATFLQQMDMPASGTFSVRTDRRLDIATASLDLSFGEGKIYAPDLWEQPRTVKNAILAVAYDKEDEKLKITKGDVDFGGPRMKLSLEANTPVPKDLLWQSRKKENNKFVLKLQLFDLPMDAFTTIWPKPVVPNARSWIAENMTKGIFKQGEVTLHGRLRLDDIENVILESGSGHIEAEGGRVTYLDGMPAVENTSAKAKFDLDHMEVLIEQGHTGPITLEPFTIVMAAFQKETQTIKIPLKVKGPVRDVLKLIDLPPLGYAKAVGLVPDDCSGQAEGIVTLSMPLLSDLLLEDIDVKAKAQLKDFAAKNLIPSIEISKGAMALDLTQNGFGLEGTVSMNDVSSQLKWTSRFGPDGGKSKPINEANVKAVVKDDEWNRFYGLGRYMSVKGETPVTVDYQNVAKGRHSVGVKATLNAAEVKVPDIAWTKPLGESARVSFTLYMQDGKDSQFTNINLQGAGLTVKGSASLDANTSTLKSVALSPFVLGRTNADIAYSIARDGSSTINVAGESVDLSGLDSGKAGAETVDKPLTETKPTEEKKPPTPMVISARVVKLYTSEDGVIGSFKLQASRSAKGWESVDLFGIAQSSVPVTIKLTPQLGKKVLSVASDDFGMMVQGLGFGNSIRGGKVTIEGESTVEKPHEIKGELKVTSFTVVDMPFLARLFSAVSPFGFIDLITGNASFDRLKGEFVWDYDRIDLRNVRTAGSVVGINMDGRINLEDNTANLRGTVVPFSFVNSILGSIPLLGDVLTGGSGEGVIAASFDVKGDLSKPDISVNPVSLLTPGFLRNIFFSGDAGESSTQPSAPKSKSQNESVPSPNNLAQPTPDQSRKETAPVR
ncbi:MAG: hypothetical protein EOM37_00175 [Proteobacteria bacterium]|nr:hypothetical protein [Pseudomonadota bacterium]